MNTPTLFDDPQELAAAVTVQRPGPSHRSDPPTSVAAAASVKTGTQRARVLLTLDLRGSQGATDDELAAILNHPRPHVCGTRRKELQDLGLVEPVGVRRPTRLGCLAHVYRLNALGRVVANEVRS